MCRDAELNGTCSDRARLISVCPWLRRRPLQTTRLGLQDYCLVESMVHSNHDFFNAPDYVGFRAAPREDRYGFSPALEASICAGKVHTRRVFGFVAVDLTCNATRVERSDWTFAVMTWSIAE